MTDRIDTAAEREKLTALTGFTPGPWEANINDKYGFIMVPLSGWDGDFKPADARLIAAAPDLLATVHRLLDALDAERAENERLREAMIDATAHLAAATSAYKNFAARHPKWGKPDQDALFGTRFKDFDAATVRARDALKGGA